MQVSERQKNEGDSRRTENARDGVDDDVDLAHLPLLLNPDRVVFVHADMVVHRGQLVGAFEAVGKVLALLLRRALDDAAVVHVTGPDIVDDRSGLCSQVVLEASSKDW